MNLQWKDDMMELWERLPDRIAISCGAAGAGDKNVFGTGRTAISRGRQIGGTTGGVKDGSGEADY